MRPFSLLLLVAACQKNNDKDSPSDSGDSGESTPTELVCPESGPPPSADTWTAAGPMPAGDIVQFSEAAGEVWAGSWLSGTWAMPAGENEWSPRVYGNTLHVYGQMAMNADDPSYVAYPSGDLWYTQNGGDTWTNLRVQDSDSKYPSRFYAVAFEGDDLLTIDEYGDVYRMTSGTTNLEWVSNMPGVTYEPPHTINEPERGIWLQVGDGRLYAYQDQQGMWLSTDGGVSWSPSLERGVQRNTLVADGMDVWAATQESDGTALMHSSDGGESWQEEARLSGVMSVRSVSPNTLGEVLVIDDETVHIWDGSSWETIVPEGTHNLLSIFVDGDGRTFLGHSFGIHQSEDGGHTWTANSDGLIDQDAAVAYSIPDCPGEVLIGTRCRSGMFRSHDYGQTIERIDEYFHYVMVIEAHPTDNNQLWISSDDSVWYSPDFGATWFDSQIKPDNAGVGVHVHGLAVDPKASCSALVGSVGSGIWSDDQGRVYRTDDCGGSWQDVSSGIPENPHSMHTILFVDSAEDVVLLGTFRGGDIAHNGEPAMGMYRSDDRGSSWSAVDDVSANNVAMLAQCNGNVYAATDVGLLRSSDGGLTWSNGLELAEGDEELVAVACHEETVITTNIRTNVWRSTDSGERFEPWEDGLPDFSNNPEPSYIVDIEITSDGSTAYVTPDGQGMYFRSL